MNGWLEISDVSCLVGRTIVAAEREPDTPGDDDFHMAENTVSLTLDDGSQVAFNGWGFDAPRLITEVRKETPGEASCSDEPPK